MSKTLDRAEMIGRLNEGIGALTTSDKWQEYLDMQAKFTRYSPRNVLLLLEQNPYATSVASYRTWESLGRTVRKGEVSLRVLAPLRYTLVDEETKDKTSVIRGFRLAPVFDISQTDGEPLPEVASKLLGQDPDQLFNKLRSVAEGLGFSVDVTTIEAPGVNGDCNHDLKEIRVSETNEPAQRVKTLAHELGHAMLHGPETKGVDRAKKELEAESVAYVVCQSFGLETGDYSFGYVAGWAGDPEKAQKLVLESAARIQKTADVIVKRVDGLAAPETSEREVELARPTEVEAQRTTPEAELNMRAIGPREVGMITFGGYGQTHSLVLDVQPERSDWMGWSVTEINCDENGVPTPGATARVHCTAWDEQNDRVVRPASPEARIEEEIEPEKVVVDVDQIATFIDEHFIIVPVGFEPQPTGHEL